MIQSYHEAIGKIGYWGNAPKSFAKWSSIICDCDHVEDSFQMADGRPVLMFYGNRTPFKEIAKRTKDIAKTGKINGLIWDYEHYEYPSEVEVVRMKKFVNALGLYLGVSTLANSRSSLAINGLDFSRSHLWCDFHLPQLYAQVHDKDPVRLKAIWEAIIRSSIVPVIPVITPLATRPSLLSSQRVLTPDEITKCYQGLNLESVVVWNAWKATKAQWKAISGLLK